MKNLKEPTIGDVIQITNDLKQTTGELKRATEILAQTTNSIMDFLITMKNQLEARLTALEKNSATKDDLNRCATKDDINRFATKDDLGRFATKDDLNRFATKDDLNRFATKDDLIQMEKKLESKFDMLFDEVGHIHEKFTVMDYKFIQLKHQVLPA